METDLKRLIFDRGQVKASLTRFKTYCTNITGPEHIQHLQSLIDKYSPIFDKFDAIQDKIEFAVQGTEHEAQQAAERDNFERVYFLTLGGAKDRLEHLRSQSLPTTSNQNTTSNHSTVADDSHTHVKLPTIKLPSFDGSYHNWLKFRDTFESMIHTNDALSKIEKFHYLNSALTGDAARTIESLGVSEASYTLAWECLKKRFEDPKLLIHHHVSALVEIPKIIKESRASLRQLIDDTNNHIRSLKSLNESSEMLGETLLIYLLSKKLDANTKREWDKHQSQISGQVSLKNMLDFLDQHSKYLERSATDKQGAQIKTTLNSTKTNRDQIERISSHVTSRRFSCALCKSDHPLYQCEDFKKITPSERLAKATQLNICFNCLQPGHRNTICNRGSCRLCSKKHHTLLHLANYSPQLAEKSQVMINSPDAQKSVTLHQTTRSKNTNSYQGLLSTAIVHVTDHKGKKHECRALLDPGSQMNFLTEEFFKKLGISCIAGNVEVSDIGRTSCHAARKTKINISSRFNNYQSAIPCILIDRITENLPSSPIDMGSLQIPSNINLADPLFGHPKKIDLLIGVEVFWDLTCVGQHRLGKGYPILQKTLLGWIVGGRAPIACRAQNLKPLCHLVTNQQLDNQLAKFWELENCDPVPNVKINSLDPCEAHFLRTTTRDKDGRYIVSIPLKMDATSLGNSRQIAERRLFSLERKFQKNSELKQRYVEFMKEYERLGHMSIVSENTENANSISCYLPHHAVYKDSSTTTKLRVVFDGSAETTSDLSLNDIQLVGPTVQDDLFSILVRFRKHRYVLSADIEKMYRQIRIRSEERSLQRILWRSCESMPIQVYELNTVTYGTASASFLATRTLRHVGECHSSKFPSASRAIIKDFYVDDLLTGTDDIYEAKQLKDNISSILHSAGFELRKWASNKSEILGDHLNQQSKNITIDKDPKILGLLWNHQSDELQYSVKAYKFTQSITKRSILSDISQIFDPLGLIGPAIIQSKIILQRLWQLRVAWDESLPQEIYTQWKAFREQLHCINSIKIPRRIIALDTAEIQLHGFCDASEKAYGACIYLRSLDREGNFIAKLICAKSRVAPLKTVSLPRLELCGALLLARLMSKIRSALEFHTHAEYYWSDSMITLSWIHSPPTKWKTFVANRTTEIQQITNNNWQHVSSNENPADIISRGINPASLPSTTLWWKGPEWLSQSREQWPSSDIISYDVPEMKSSCLIAFNPTQNLQIFLRFSSLTQLIRVLSYCLRFVRNTRSSINSRHSDSKANENLNSSLNRQPLTGFLSASELQYTMQALTRAAQNQHFIKEIEILKRGDALHKSNSIASLNPFIDNAGILRVGGRLTNANIPFDQKHPIILPPKHPLTKLIVKHEHLKLLHGGCQAVMASLRTKYWPLSCKGIVKGVIRSCVRCFRARPIIAETIMGNLPASRITSSRAFESSGVDYAGPFLLKEKSRGRVTQKGYLCVFVCFSTKAVHLELATDLSTDAFINCLHRFLSRRGICRNIYSDNGTNFVGARNELNNLGILLSTKNHSERVTRFLADKQIQWHLIPPRAPHFGGLWESAVKSAKYHLKRVIGDTKLTFEELYTLLTQIEACMNSRPLSPLSSDPDDLAPLTPGHFLIGDALTAIPQPDIHDIKISRLTRYQHIQYMLQHFWRRWHVEYLQHLQHRHKWRSSTSSALAPGVLVIIKEDNLPPLKWRLGRILELHPGKDHKSRVASIRVSDGTVRRPITKLCILPMDEDDDSPISTESSSPPNAQSPH